jgi:LysM repeat protein
MSLIRKNDLVISAYKTAKRTKKVNVIPSEFVCQINPSVIHISYGGHYSQIPVINSTNPPVQFASMANRELRMTLNIDGSGAVSGLLSQSVAQRIKHFLALTHDYHGDIHEPAFLIIKWGWLKTFSCRLSNVDIEYTEFDSQGNPTQAVLETLFIEDVPATKSAQLAKKSSPDLSHIHQVSAGESLPIIAAQYYGNASYYLQLAQFNQLDHLDQLEVGNQLQIPPLSDDVQVLTELEGVS